MVDLLTVIIMERILLVEPNYKNKYPPIGLMKISSYYKNKGDFVQFHKGLLPKNEVVTFNKVFITTLFTFDFDMCIKSIKYYASIVGLNNIFVGGIAATIMPEKFKQEIPTIKILTGQLTSSSVLGYSDDVNIDVLPLDYDILWDIEYDYPAADSYFIYTSRGCPRKCSFCAVKTLEPDFYDCPNIEGQIKRVDEQFGIKKNLLIMDNNILYSTKFEENVGVIESLGFGIKNNTCQKNSNMPYFLISLSSRIDICKNYNHLLARIKKEFKAINFNRVNSEDKLKLRNIIALIDANDDVAFVQTILNHKEYISSFFSRYNYHKIKRYIDFNQGLDARLFTEKKAEIMSRLAVKPCRIAFDHLETKDTYLTALENAAKYGIKDFSNYLLFNYKDKPEDLWTRLSINIDFCERHKDKKVSLFSFPMKYASIEEIDRNFVGEFWCKKYLRAINIILNVTSGVVAKEKDFFERAYGTTPEEFIEILSMPDDFIRFRNFFDDIGLSKIWKKMYSQLSTENKNLLIKVLSEFSTDLIAVERNTNEQLNDILQLYTIKKNSVEKNKLYYKRLYNLL